MSDDEIYVPLKQRQQERVQRLLQKQKRSAGSNSSSEDDSPRKRPRESDDERGREEAGRQKASLFDEVMAAKAASRPKTAEEKRQEEEAELLKNLQAQRKLQSVAELAKGVSYTSALKGSWEAPGYLRHQSYEEQEKIREQMQIITEGTNVPPVCTTFKEMKVPRAILRYLKHRGIKTPSLIQAQGIPVAYNLFFIHFK